ncbi:MAG: EamA family transporter [Gammaproteobacteria bacterium]|nr:EamA family transporter [Gammaproteobacteria bacterium]
MRRSALWFALSAALLWGVSGTVAADVFDKVPPPRVAEVRALVAALFLVPYAGLRGRLRTDGNGWWLILFGLTLAAVHVTYYWAIDGLGVGPGVTVQFLAPIVVLIWMRFAKRHHVAFGVWVAAVGAVGGLVMVTRAWEAISVNGWALGAGLASALTFATYLLMGEWLGHRIGAVTTLTYGFVVAAVFWLVVQPLWTFPRGLEAKDISELVWVGLGGTMVPFLLEMAALRRAAAAVVGLVATVEPVIAAVTAWILLSQALTLVQIVGGAAVLGAVLLVQRQGVAEIEAPMQPGR